MNYFPVVSPVSHVTNQRGVQPGNKVDPIYPRVLHTVFITQPFYTGSIFVFSYESTVCVVIFDVDGGVFYFKISWYVYMTTM